MVNWIKYRYWRFWQWLYAPVIEETNRLYDEVELFKTAMETSDQKAEHYFKEYKELLSEYTRVNRQLQKVYQALGLEYTASEEE